MSEGPREGEFLGEYRTRMGFAGSDTAAAKSFRRLSGRWVRQPVAVDCERLAPAGRAVTLDQKRAIVERLLAAWLLVPDQCLGQLIQNASGEAFYVEDEALIECVEAWAYPRRRV